MINDSEIQKPIVELIFDELFLLLEEKGFDLETIERLQQLAQNGELKSAKKVTKAIKVLPEDRE